MASSGKELTCPRCSANKFFSQRALSVRLNSQSCLNHSIWGATLNSAKHKCHTTSTTNAKLASSIFDSINKRHFSGSTRKDHSLSIINFAISQLFIIESISS